MPDENHPLPPPDPVIIVQPQDYQTEVKDFSSSRPAFRNTVRPPRSKLPLILFVLTCLSTFIVGATHHASFVPVPREFARVYAQIQLYGWSTFLTDGISYAGPLMLILLSHEMGHYLQSRRYHIPATRPLFIPMPISPFGTMGAVILQKGGIANRKQMFDIAISGPLAGLVFALPVAYWGVLKSTVIITSKQPGTYSFGEPLILQWMVNLVHGPLAENQEVVLNPLLFAGWVGIFITALNLIPIGQLDGGHILYTLLGKTANLIARGLMLLVVAYMFYTGNFGYAPIFILLFLFGVTHPPTADDTVPLGAPRIILGWLTLAFFIIGFTVTPIIIY